MNEQFIESHDDHREQEKFKAVNFTAGALWGMARRLRAGEKVDPEKLEELSGLLAVKFELPGTFAEEIATNWRTKYADPGVDPV